MNIAQYIWHTRYRYVPVDGGTAEQSIEQSWRRVATAVASVETSDTFEWSERFYNLLQGYRFLPGGRILAGAGTQRDVSLFNCFVMGTIEDDMEGIFQHLKEGALTMQAGGGVGYDFSTLRPKGSAAKRTGNTATGPVSFMAIWDAMCATVLTTGARRGAMLASLRCDHPDIIEFIEAKRVGGGLHHFNLSVQITDDFIDAVHQDAEWPLVFPLAPSSRMTDDEILMRVWTGQQVAGPCRVHARVRAREIWHKLMLSAYTSSEPGVLFVDRINQQNNLYYREHLTTTNPCGEIPLPPYGACDLGSINLTRFVYNPFTQQAKLDMSEITEVVRLAVRLLDNVIDLSRFPLPQQAEQARGARRIGLGLTGLADSLAMLGLHYGSAAGRRKAREIMQQICYSAYRASIKLSDEKGPFPFFKKKPYAESAFIRAMPVDIQQGISEYGIRNSHLTAIAPTGTISLLSGNISSGMEPIFEFDFHRRILSPDGVEHNVRLTDYAWQLWQEFQARDEHKNPPDGSLDTENVEKNFVAARELKPEQHLEMQAALQPSVDSAISKTINVPIDIPFADFQSMFEKAHALGLKGCTVFREISDQKSVLSGAHSRQDIQKI